MEFLFLVWYQVLGVTKRIHRSQEPQTHIHDTPTRSTTDLSQVLETAVQGWQYCEKLVATILSFTQYMFMSNNNKYIDM